jgi:hypothetical protein
MIQRRFLTGTYTDRQKYVLESCLTADLRGRQIVTEIYRERELKSEKNLSLGGRVVPIADGRG